MTNPNQTPTSTSREIHELSVGDRALVGVAVAGGAVLWVVFAGAWLAARLAGHGLAVEGADAFAVIFRLPTTLGNPATAWPQPAADVLPGPWLYWPCTAVAALPLGALGWWWRRRDRRRLGLERRVRLGVDAEARMAEPDDLAPIVVDGPTPGRMILGTVHGRLVATEAPQSRPTAAPAKASKPAPAYRPTRGSVMVIGPSQSGKSTMVICGVLEWSGPAILSSVKTDLIAETFGWRSQRGECRVYDPCKVTGLAPAAWSPLRGAGTWAGAQAAAHAVRECAPPTKGENAAFFESSMERLLAGYLWVAAATGRSMRDVHRWICSQDAPSEFGPGEVATLVQAMLAGSDPAVAADASYAAETLQSVWALEDRTRSNIFATVQASVWPWSHPDVVGSSHGCDVSLDWLLGGENTLYVAAPLNHAKRLSPAIGGVLADLIEQVTVQFSRTGRPLDPPLLLVLDEIGNTPLRALPEHVSTLAGMGVLVVTVWQSIAQIHAAYGPQAATVIGNHRSKVLFSGISDVETGTLVKQLLGDEQVLSRQLSSDLGSIDAGRRSLQESLITTGVVPAHVLRQQQSGSALLIHGTIPPAHLIARSQFNDPELYRRASLPLPPSTDTTPTRPTAPATDTTPSTPAGVNGRPSRLRIISAN